MITYKEVDKTYFKEYDKIPMQVDVKSHYIIEKINRGLGGFKLVEKPVEPYVKEFNLDEAESVSKWEKQFDISNWTFFMAFDGEVPVGAAAVVSRTEDVYMLSGRNDIAVLWDIRVSKEYKRQGVGQKLFDMAVDWSRRQNLVQMKIECQNNNVPAVNFYHKQGAVLSMIDEYAYYDNPKIRDEVKFIWYLDL